MYLRRLYPTPSAFSEDESRRFTFGARVTAAVSGLSEKGQTMIKRLWRRFGCDASELHFSEGGGGFSFRLGTASCRLGAGESYAIEVNEGGVCVAAADEGALRDGLKTLVQLICPVDLNPGRESFYISAATVHDAPKISFRAIHVCVFPDSRLYTIEKAIHLAGFLKMTHLVLEFWGTFRYECQKALSWRGRSYTAAELKPLIDLAREYGLEVIPMLNHLGHATQSRSIHGRHTVLDTDLRLSRLFEPDGWPWCVSNPDTLKLLGDMRDELIALCGPGGYFHLGCDEAYSFGTCDICRRRAPDELLSEHLNRLTEDLSARGRRPIIWHDQLIRRSDFGPGPIVANGETGNTAGALNKLDRRIIIADWQYDYAGGFNPTTKVFMDAGFDTVICPWDNPENIRSVTANVRDMGAYGVMLTTWHHLPEFLRHAGFWADGAWSAQPQDAPLTEGAALLRRLYDAQGDYERAGWNKDEVEQ